MSVVKKNRKLFHKLRVHIVKEYRIPKVDACELVDLISWGFSSAERVIWNLEAERLEEQEIDFNYSQIEIPEASKSIVNAVDTMERLVT